MLDENVISFVKTATDTEEEFDVIVLDPLKLSTSISSLDKASWKYHAFNHDAINLLN